MNKIAKTPFAEYREEQVKLNIFDYFVEPSFFDMFCDAKPILISGSRGTGKTTILKALTMSEAKDIEHYLQTNDYIGIYYRIDLNITNSFHRKESEKDQWEKLFAYYCVAKLSHILIEQFIAIKSKVRFENEEQLSRKYAMLFAGEQGIFTLEQLGTLISDELRIIRNYINNSSYSEYPHIGDYATIIRELPKDLLQGSSAYRMNEKTIFYLIDEFEGLSDWQQKIILSFVKYSDKYQSYKICMRPDGLKTAQTIGAEYIRETDDIRTVELNSLILDKKEDYYKYALDVCKKRMELFYLKNELVNHPGTDFEEMFDERTEDEELEAIFRKKSDVLAKDVELFLEQSKVSDEEIKNFCLNNYFRFLILRLLCWKDRKKEDFRDVFIHVRERDSRYTNAVGNYKHALVYYLCLRFAISKNYSGFGTLVNISGGTLRYLLELCNEIFERAVMNENFDYENPHKISCKTQTDAVTFISNKRVNQISAIPQLGLNMRAFVMALGKIFQIFHQDERIAKFEPNHFSIKPTTMHLDENLSLFLKECVMRGVLLKVDNNKQKVNHTISSDEYLYILHPIYTPCFQISWRRKQKAEFEAWELKILISDETTEINKIIKDYEKRYLKDKEQDSSEDEYPQMHLKLKEDE